VSGRKRGVPSYCRHKASGQAVVRIAGNDIYLGVFDTPESHEKYRRVVAEHLTSPMAAVSGIAGPTSTPSVPTVIELTAAYWLFASSYYCKNGQPTSEQTSIRLAFRPLLELYGRVKVTEFGPLCLEAVRQKMIDARITRNRINQHVGRIRRMFEWAVSKELIPVTIYQSLLSVKGLRKGRSAAKESEPVLPVSQEHVAATLPFLTAQIQAMVRLQYLLGCRPEEITLIRPCDIREREGSVWEYVPMSHKTEHHERQRRICIGQQAQEILLPWLDRSGEMYCFSPKEARAAFDAERKRKRQTPRTPSSRARQRKRKPRKQPGIRYTTKSYGYSIRKACKKAGVPQWCPLQLRHSRGTEIRKEFGLEACQVILGHSKADVTQIYAERDFDLAKRVTQKMG
jgi:integrase